MMGWLGFKESYVDPSLFLWVQDDEIIFLFAYVDNIVVTGSSKKQIEEVIVRLGKEFALRELRDLVVRVFILPWHPGTTSDEEGSVPIAATVPGELVRQLQF